MKVRRTRILSARIFSKSFGGKIKQGVTDVKKETTFTKETDITKRWLIKFVCLLSP